MGASTWASSLADDGNGNGSPTECGECKIKPPKKDFPDRKSIGVGCKAEAKGVAGYGCQSFLQLHQHHTARRHLWHSLPWVSATSLVERVTTRPYIPRTDGSVHTWPPSRPTYHFPTPSDSFHHGLHTALPITPSVQLLTTSSHLPSHKTPTRSCKSRTSRSLLITGTQPPRHDLNQAFYHCACITPKTLPTGARLRTVKAGSIDARLTIYCLSSSHYSDRNSRCWRLGEDQWSVWQGRAIQPSSVPEYDT